MIVRRVGVGDEQRGQAEGRQLGQARRAGARDGEVSRAVNFLHPMMKGRDMRGNVFAPVIILQQTRIATAGKMNHLERDALQRGHRLDQRLVDAARALAAAHHEQGRDSRTQP